MAMVMRIFQRITSLMVHQSTIPVALESLRSYLFIITVARL
jgi:hypothetical protein